MVKDSVFHSFDPVGFFVSVFQLCFYHVLVMSYKIKKNHKKYKIIINQHYNHKKKRRRIIKHDVSEFLLESRVR